MHIYSKMTKGKAHYVQIWPFIQYLNKWYLNK